MFLTKNYTIHVDSKNLGLAVREDQGFKLQIYSLVEAYTKL